MDNMGVIGYQEFEGPALMQRDLNNANFIATTEDGLKFYPAITDGSKLQALAYHTFQPAESENIFWQSVKTQATRSATVSDNDFEMIVSLLGINSGGEEVLVGEKVFRNCGITETTEDIVFDLKRSACKPNIAVTDAAAASGKLRLNLPIRSKNFENFLLNIGSYSGWKRYKNIPITGKYEYSKVNVPIFISVPHNPNINEDFSDIRFVDWNGNILTHSVYMNYNMFALNIENGGENGTTSGIPAAASTLTSSTEQAKKGTHSFKLVSNGSSSDSYMAPGGDGGAMRCGMVAGKTYTASAYIYVPSATGLNPDDVYGRGLSITLYYKDSGGTYHSVISNKPTVTGQFVKLKVTAEIPLGATEAFVRYYNGFAASGKVVYWDELRLNEGLSDLYPCYAVMLPTTPLTGEVEEITMWYKKSDATSAASELSSIFLKYDMFDDSVFNAMWSLNALTGSVVENGNLQMAINAGTDGRWTTSMNKGPILFTSIPTGDMRASVKVELDTINASSAKGLFVMLDSNRNYFYRIEIGYDTANKIFLTKNEGSGESTVASFAFANQAVWLYIERLGPYYFFGYATSRDEEDIIWFWQLTPTFTPTTVGMHTRNWNTAAFPAITSHFSEFHVISAGGGIGPEVGSFGSEKVEAYNGTWSYSEVEPDSFDPDQTYLDFTVPTLDLCNQIYFTLNKYDCDPENTRLMVAKPTQNTVEMGYDAASKFEAFRLKFELLCSNEYNVKFNKHRYEYMY